MTGWLKMAVVGVVKAIAGLLLGLQVYQRGRLPATGPAILVANHNSHLDALVLMALYPLGMAARLRPVANEQYFLHHGALLAWFARQVLAIIPVPCESLPRPTGYPYRTFLQACDAALAQSHILILFPEGSRGEPERLSEFHSGIAHLARRHPQVPVVPIFLHGLGKALPKGDPLLVPFVCGVAIGPALYWAGCKHTFLHDLTAHMQTLSHQFGAAAPSLGDRGEAAAP